MATWDRVALDKEDFKKLFLLFLTPLLVISSAVQAAGWVYLGRYGNGLKPVCLPMDIGVRLGLVLFAVNIVVVLICSQSIKAVTKTFHRRNTQSQAFCLAAHALSPFFAASMLDAIPEISPWATFGIAISLSLSTLYYGVPRVLEPDPPSAFGIYFVSALMMFGVAGLARFVFFILAFGRPHLTNISGILNLISGSIV